MHQMCCCSMHESKWKGDLQVTLAAAGQSGTLGATLPATQLRHVVTHEAHVSHKYPYKFLRAALMGPGATRAERAAQVTIDANGLLKARPL